MSQIKLTIDEKKIEVPEGTSILEASRMADIYIPTLCDHPDFPSASNIQAVERVYQGDRVINNTLPDESPQGCGLCLVEVQGEAELIASCSTETKEGMVVITDNERIRTGRQEKLVPILARHRHACLICAQQEGCSRSQCSSNVPENERCCTLFGHCELQKVANHIGISDATPKWIPTDLPVLDNDPLFVRDYNLCVGCLRCIKVCKDVRGIEAIGFVYDDNGQIQIGTLAPTLETSGCKFCTACVEICPTGALMDKSVRPGKREEDIVPCKHACPVGIDIPEYLRLIAQGKRNEANAVIREKVPLPGILGRVCVHPCEDVCRRGAINEPVAICALKRYAADGDQGLWKSHSRIKQDSGKKIAVIGSGPAGLTAAFYLRKQGHAVVIFESRDKAGGMLRYGIPGYRLPIADLDKEIDEIFDLGIDFRPNNELGKDFTIEQLKSDGFDAVFLAVGAPLSSRISIEGSELEGVLWGVDFLKQIAEGEDISLKEKVMVIGGGNVAIDVSRTALRTGAKDITILYRRSLEEMPALKEEIEHAIVEGVTIETLTAPVSFMKQCQGREMGIRCIKMKLDTPDESGRPSPVPIEGSEFEIGCDQVILAIGQNTDLSFLPDEGLIKSHSGLIVVDRESLETDMEKVYAGGDVITGPATVINAVAAGRKAASHIDSTFDGSGNIEEVLFEKEIPNPYLGKDEGFASSPRETVPELQVEARCLNFQEVSLGYPDDQAIKEAKRCLQCDLRLLMKSNPSPPEKIFSLKEENMTQVPETEGVFQLYDEDRKVIAIKGTSNLKTTLLEELEDNTKAAWFDFEEDKMYSMRESELIQRYLQEHGEMPGGGDSDLDDLF